MDGFLLQEKVIIIDGALDNDSFTLSITDNAGGIPDQIINNIFNQYFPTKSHANGIGKVIKLKENEKALIRINDRIKSYQGKYTEKEWMLMLKMTYTVRWD